MDALPPFPGFREEAFAFLRDLRQHNERDWFKPRKATYDDELLWPARCLIGELAEALPRAGVPLTGTPKKAPFRIYRDTRFSKNKDPYKTHLGLVLSRDGTKKARSTRRTASTITCVASMRTRWWRLTETRRSFAINSAAPCG